MKKNKYLKLIITGSILLIGVLFELLNIDIGAFMIGFGVVQIMFAVQELK